MKSIIGATAALAMTGCGAVPVGDVVKGIFNPEPEAPISIPNIDRAAIERADLAAVLVISPSARIAAPAAAVQMRKSLLIYNTNDNRSVTMNGGLIYSTLGFGTNLHAVLTQQDDPLVNDTVAADWPDTVRRTYQLSGRGITFNEIVTTCESRVSKSTEIEVVEVMRAVVEIVEICTTDDGASFNNIHYVDASSGRVWRTSQWTGPVQENVQVDVIEQFDPNS